MSDDAQSEAVSSFFDAMSDEYGAAIERCVPRYREMLTNLVAYVPRRQTQEQILELGCGTGNLSILLAKAFPEATIQLVDVSAESLDICRSRIAPSPRIKFLHADMRRLNIPANSLNLVVSSIAVHHLDTGEKERLFRSAYDWLRPQGLFTYADQFSGATPDIYARHMSFWKQAALDLGASEDEWATWLEHQRSHDHHEPLTDQIDALRRAGFGAIDCTWRFLLWTILQARKT